MKMRGCSTSCVRVDVILYWSIFFFFWLSKSCTGISLNCSLLALMTTNLLSVHFFFSLKLCAYENRLACENIRFSSLFAIEDVSSSRNIPSGEERGETDVFAG